MRSISPTSRAILVAVAGRDRVEGGDVGGLVHALDEHALPSGMSTPVGVSVWQNSSPCRPRSAPSAAKAGEVMNSTKVVAITSWTKPGAVISSVRMQPPMRSLRSSTSTLPPLPASSAAQTSALMPLPTMM